MDEFSTHSSARSDTCPGRIDKQCAIGRYLSRLEHADRASEDTRRQLYRTTWRSRTQRTLDRQPARIARKKNPILPTGRKARNRNNTARSRRGSRTASPVLEALL